MFKEIKIGEQTIPMIANGATPIRYRQLFHKDIITKMNGGTNADDAVEMASELAFVMAKSAEKADMSTLNMDDYYEWLEQCEALELLRNAGSIITLYAGNRATTSEVKKKQGVRQSGK